MKSKVMGKWNKATDIQKYRIMKLSVAVLFTVILCIMFFVMIPLNEHIGLLDRIWTYVSTVIGVLIFMIVQVNIVGFVYNRFIANDIDITD